MIDPLVYVAVAVVVGLLLLVVTWIGKGAVSKAINEETRGGRRRPGPTVGTGEPGPRVAGRGAAPARRRMRRTRDVEDDDDDDDGGETYGGPDLSFEGEKIGAKKLRKLQEKAEKKAAREAEVQEREDRKKRQEEMDKLRAEDEARQKLLEEKQAEEERKRKEEQEQREHEEYLKMKEMFSVDEEGQDADDTEQDAEALLQIFIDHVKENKVVMLEDLAAEFKLKTQDCIDRVKSLLDEGRLTGVMDDRGKFIYITTDELNAVAKFIKQRGRVSIQELAECSNKLIRLTPEISPELGAS